MITSLGLAPLLLLIGPQFVPMALFTLLTGAAVTVGVS